MKKPISIAQIDWFGKKVILELFNDVKFEKLSPIVQVQAISFIDKGHIVLYKSSRDNYGCPGGHPEGNETWEETLNRETHEEIAAKVLSCGPIGYIKETNLETSEIKYQLRYWSFVELLDEPINDPDDHSRERYVFPLSEALEKLNWGEMGDRLVKLACQNIEKYE